MDRVILQALKTYGVIVADNGSPWYIQGTPDNYWNNDVLHELDGVTGNDFQAVNESCLEVSRTLRKQIWRTASPSQFRAGVRPDAEPGG